ncbi:hypothetical protein METBIDRAFT_77139 [Metschnikowia bicuspidata var. bicuspidata NRRL YB-4993]|uniref:Uncharacterized protein n=1 Tax=Metschnikowia bicuspidata var. bicuspidata NRRL YB-4993 TaxID=869754 RepID=A0A1A0HKI4_9ASCO|nr:hypothetical protein METBIDRAFT_77139 [Metschnikowia bicuspidata var. bicuspidata NRRL YB-4993]OBA24318.1 hypothetical protein METBIDRAFT_77139 [Metschnikowia bicuspidata var. bicuspidata NRRL YB-4993]
MKTPKLNTRPLRLLKKWGNSPTAWIRHNLFLLGYEKVRFYAYQKLSPLAIQKGGGFIKCVVADLNSFVKREWASEGELFLKICSSVHFFEDANIPDLRLFFTSVGSMMLSGKEKNVRIITDELLELYIEKLRGKISLDTPASKSERQILKISTNYYQTCKINYRTLYDPKIGPRSITIGDRTFSIKLPPLPQISSKQLLARALLHKEMYPALMLPGHTVHDQLSRSQILMAPATAKVLRYDLLFLDGLGDLLIASESCQILYQFRLLHPYSSDTSFGKKTFTLLKNILGTNSLLLRLATAYNMHLALEDPTVSTLLRESYIPQTFAKATADTDIGQYEEEFLADYFEQYSGALFLDLPEAAKEWLSELFERILALISDTYRINHRRDANALFDYRAWSVDVIGRSI